MHPYCWAINPMVLAAFLVILLKFPTKNDKSPHKQALVAILTNLYQHFKYNERYYLNVSRQVEFGTLLTISVHLISSFCNSLKMTRRIWNGMWYIPVWSSGLNMMGESKKEKKPYATTERKWLAYIKYTTYMYWNSWCNCRLFTGSK